MKRDEWISRCAAHYRKRAGLSEEESIEAASIIFENYEIEELPEVAANMDMSYWDDDEWARS